MFAPMINPPEGNSMKSQVHALVITVGLIFGATAFAQTAAPAAKASAPTAAAPTAKAATAGAKTASPSVSAVGGGNGKVWVNSKSKTYHCEGTKFYGKTKSGEYMTEADAKTKGNHPDHGKVCSK
jgi:hypothetical protein